MRKITIGCDPEFFLYDKKKRQYISAHQHVQGTKREPFKLPNGGAVQLDGLAVEFNIPPSATKEEFSKNISSSLHEIRKSVPKSLAFSFTPTVVFPKKYFDNRVPEYCKELGCTPDFSAENNGEMKPPPRPPVSTMRTGAGHIHIGWTKDQDFEEHIGDGHFYRCVQTVRLFDAYVNLYKHHWDRDRRRHSLYGASGAFRPKHYGVECRSLSNAWLNHEELWPWLHEVASLCAHEWNNKSLHSLLLSRRGATNKFKKDILNPSLEFPLSLKRC